MRNLGTSRDVYGRRQQPRRLALALVITGTVLVTLAVNVAVDQLIHRGASPAAGPSTSGVPGLGPADTALGVPVGYAHTPQGAAQAVGNYLAALGGRLALNSAADQAALDQVADPSTREQLDAGLATSLRADEGLWGIQSAAAQGRRVIVTQTPIAYRVTSYTNQIATVGVWLVVNIGVENHQRLAAFFANGGATVTWRNGDWRLHEIDNGSAAGSVVPACLQTPTQTGGVPAQLDGFTPYGS